eukprot:SAG31_NODE_518_length_14674_cov_39.604803_3_plen_409_part_00
MDGAGSTIVTTPGDTAVLLSGKGGRTACTVVARQGRRVRLEMPDGSRVWREREQVLQPASLAMAALRHTLNSLSDPVGFCRGLDRNGDGVVTAAELAQGAADAGVSLGPEECAGLIELADQDGDGLLSIGELATLAAVLRDVRALQADLCPQPQQQQSHTAVGRAVLGVELYVQRPSRRRHRVRRRHALPICDGYLAAETLVFLSPNARRSELLAALNAELNLEDAPQRLRERLGGGSEYNWSAAVSNFQKDPTVADLLSLDGQLPTPSHSDTGAGNQTPAVALQLTNCSHDATWLQSWTAKQNWRLRYSFARQRLALASILHPRLNATAIDASQLSDPFRQMFANNAPAAHFTRAREHASEHASQYQREHASQPDEFSWLNDLGPLVTMQATKLYFAVLREDAEARG